MLRLIDGQARLQGVADVSAAFLLIQFDIFVGNRILLVLGQKETLHVRHRDNIIVGQINLAGYIVAAGVIIAALGVSTFGISVVATFGISAVGRIIIGRIVVIRWIVGGYNIAVAILIAVIGLCLRTTDKQ